MGNSIEIIDQRIFRQCFDILPGDPDRWAYRDDFHQACRKYRQLTRSNVKERVLYQTAIQYRKQRFVGNKTLSKNKRRVTPQQAPLKPYVATLARLYDMQDRSLDDLPYTPEFHQLHQHFCEAEGFEPSYHDVYWQLFLMRKSRKLPTGKKRRAAEQTDALLFQEDQA